MLGNLEITKQDEGEFFLIILNVLALKKGQRGQAVSPGGRAHQQRWTHQSALKATCLPLLPLSLSWDPPLLRGKDRVALCQWLEGLAHKQVKCLALCSAGSSCTI